MHKQLLQQGLPKIIIIWFFFIFQFLGKILFYQILFSFVFMKEMQKIETLFPSYIHVKTSDNIDRTKSWVNLEDKFNFCSINGQPFVMKYWLQPNFSVGRNVCLISSLMLWGIYETLSFRVLPGEGVILLWHLWNNSRNEGGNKQQLLTILKKKLHPTPLPKIERKLKMRKLLLLRNTVTKQHILLLRML